MYTSPGEIHQRYGSGGLPVLCIQWQEARSDFFCWSADARRRKPLLPDLRVVPVLALVLFASASQSQIAARACLLRLPHKAKCAAKDALAKHIERCFQRQRMGAFMSLFAKRVQQ